MNLMSGLFDPKENALDPYGSIVPPIYQTSNFAFDSVESFRLAFLAEADSTLYTRGNNPSQVLLCQKLAALEKTESCLVFSSGIAAISATICSFLKAGDHVICVKGAYSWTNKLLINILEDFGVSHSFVDGRSMEEIMAAKTDHTRMLILESPNSMYFHLQDIKAACDWAKKNDILTTLDNSYATPLFQNPAELGVDLVTHSISKYIAGHSDVVAGAVMGSKELIDHIFYKGYMTFGAVMSPHDASLILRGLRTLPVRMKRIQETTEKVVDYLVSHEKVSAVHHLGHSSHPQYDLACQQMSGSTGLFSFELQLGTREEAEAFADALEHIRIAVSWGGYESLIIPLVTFWDASAPAEEQHPWNLYRLSIGLEDVKVIIEDLERGFAAI